MTLSSVAAGRNPHLLAVLCVTGAAAMFSLHDVLIKLLSEGYALHQITFIRGMVASLVTLLLIIPLDGGYRGLLTPRWRVHLFRVFLVIVANMSFYAGLASLPIGEATAIYFFVPLVITGLSALVLRERVGPRRLAAVLVGFLGVLLVVRPGADSFQTASLLPLLAALCYGALQVSTRYIGLSERASIMAFYMQFGFIFFSASVGLAFGNGHLAGSSNQSIEFLMRAWMWPAPEDWPVLIGLGFIVAFAAFLASVAYRSAESAFVAPFEYVAMPLAITFGILVWGDWPDVLAWIGILLIAASGVFVFLREAWIGRRAAGKEPVRPAP